MVHIALAGLPATTVYLGTDFVTTEPAATSAPLPTVTPGRMMLPDPIYAQSSIMILPK